jgi:hypothetical protein
VNLTHDSRASSGRKARTIRRDEACEQVLAG